jgi:hypothetical protein
MGFDDRLGHCLRPGVQCPFWPQADMRMKFKDAAGRAIRVGDVVRVLGVPNLSGMRAPYRKETEGVFRHIVGARKRIRGFDQFGCAILMFGIRRGHRYAGAHSVAIETRLLRKLNVANDRKQT